MNKSDEQSLNTGKYCVTPLSCKMKDAFETMKVTNTVHSALYIIETLKKKPGRYKKTDNQDNELTQREARGDRCGPKMGQISLKWNKSGTFSDQIQLAKIY